MNKILTLVIGLFFLNSYSFSQDSLGMKIPEPDFPFEPMLLDSNNHLTPLPQEHYEILQTGGFTEIEVDYRMKTPNSSFIINKSKSINLIVKQGLINGSVTNVKDIYYLYKAKIVFKKERRVTAMKVKANVTKMEDGLDIVYKKIKDDIFLLTLNIPEPGEYVIVATVTKTNIFSFSVR